MPSTLPVPRPNAVLIARAGTSTIAPADEGTRVRIPLFAATQADCAQRLIL